MQNNCPESVEVDFVVECSRNYSRMGSHKDMMFWVETAKNVEVLVDERFALRLIDINI